MTSQATESRGRRANVLLQVTEERHKNTQVRRRYWHGQWCVAGSLTGWRHESPGRQEGVDGVVSGSLKVVDVPVKLRLELTRALPLLS